MESFRRRPALRRGVGKLDKDCRGTQVHQHLRNYGGMLDGEELV
jgi:hypothetical protein